MIAVSEPGEAGENWMDWWMFYSMGSRMVTCSYERKPGTVVEAVTPVRWNTGHCLGLVKGEMLKRSENMSEADAALRMGTCRLWAPLISAAMVSLLCEKLFHSDWNKILPEQVHFKERSLCLLMWQEEKTETKKTMCHFVLWYQLWQEGWLT